MTNLSEHDFEIFDRGVRRKISSFATVNLSNQPPDAGVGGPAGRRAEQAEWRW